MANDIVFKKKTFGGYDQNSVMEYINRIVSEKSELEAKLANANDKNATLNMQIHEFENQIVENERLSSEILELKTQLESLNAQLAEKEELLKSKDEEIFTQRSALSAALDNTVGDEEIEALKAENIRLKNECERKKDLERQVGAAMLDARVRSDELLEDAKKRADGATRQVYDAIGETAVKIDDLSSGIGEIARSFTKAVEEVELRIKVLTGDMSKTAQALISDTSAVSGTASASAEQPSGISYSNEPETVTFESGINSIDY